MSIFNRFKVRRESTQTNENNGGEWGALANEPLKSDEQIRQERLERNKQIERARLERKVVAAMYSGDLGVLEHDDATINKGSMEATIVQKIANGEINIDERGRKILGNMPTAVTKDGVETVRNRFGGDLHQKSVVAYFGGLDWENRAGAGVDEIEKVVDKYPTIMDFMEAAQSFLDMIEESNGKEKRKEYENAVRSVGVKLYGDEQAVALLIVGDLKNRAENEKNRLAQREALWKIYDKK